MNNFLKFLLIFIVMTLFLHVMYYLLIHDKTVNRRNEDKDIFRRDTGLRRRRGILVKTTTVKTTTTKINSSLSLCPSLPEKLGPIPQTIDGNSIYLPEGILFSAVKGGWGKPSRCKASQSVAIIIPYVSRDNNMFLSAFLYAIHPILAKQLLDYRIFVVQSSYDSPFLDLPGKLMNIGVKQAMLFRPDWSCFIFHHPQMLPLNSKNMYQCSATPRQLASSFVLSNLHHEADNWVLIKSKERSVNAVGGVLAMTYNQLMKVKGFTNTILDMDDVFSNMIDRINKTFHKLEINSSSICEYAIFKPSLHRLYKRYFSKFSGWTRSPWNENDGLMSPSLNDDISSINVTESFLHTLIQVNYIKP